MFDIGTIRVGNKRVYSEHKPEPGEIIVNIDRPNILCNPFPVNERTCRGTSLLAFKADFEQEIARCAGPRYKAVCEIVEKLLAGYDVILMCWCHPLPCHGDTIKTVVENLVRPPKHERPQRIRDG